MSLAKYRKIRRKKTPLWLQLLYAGAVLLFGGITAFIVTEFYKNQLFDVIFQILATDTRFLLIFLLNVFLIGGTAMVLIYQWVDRENIRFKSLRNRYRSMLVSPNYYRSIRRISIDESVTGSMDSGSGGKLDIEYGLKTSTLVSLDETRIHKDAKQTHIHYTDGKLDGVFRTYFANGNLLAEISYRNGQLNGRSVVYYPNGFLHTEKYFNDGKLHGVFRAWDEDGALFFEIEYQDDIQHGFDRSYRKNGIIEYEDTYDTGVMTKRKTFDDAGQFKYLQKYREDS